MQPILRLRSHPYAIDRSKGLYDRISGRTSRLYYRVLVFATLKDLRAYWRSHPERKGGRHAQGGCSTWARGEGGNELGEIMLARGYCDIERVTHEVVHACCGLMRHHRVRLSDEVCWREEFLAYNVGMMTAGIIGQLRKAGIE